MKNTLALHEEWVEEQLEDYYHRCLIKIGIKCDHMVKEILTVDDIETYDDLIQYMKKYPKKTLLCSVPILGEIREQLFPKLIFTGCDGSLERCKVKGPIPDEFVFKRYFIGDIEIFERCIMELKEDV